MMNNKLVMRPQWYGILLAGYMAGCAAAPAADAPVKPVPDHFSDGLDTLTSDVAHPCSSDVDVFGASQLHYTFIYDALGHTTSKIGTDATGAPTERLDYTWDNTGHMTGERDANPGSNTLSITTWLYDSLGRLTESEGSTIDTAQQITTVQSTTTYSDFDALGHPGDSSQVINNLVTSTSQTQTQQFSYDDLGRQTADEVRDGDGNLQLDVQRVYDDTAQTVTTTITSPQPLPSGQPQLITTVDHYDGDGHLLLTHQENADANGVVSTLQDTVITWDGNRDLSEVLTISPPDHSYAIHMTTTYQYQCTSAPAK